MKDKQLRIGVLLSLQRAMLGEIPPNLRGITVDWDSDSINILCLFDGSISETDEESMQNIETEVMADFPDHEVNLKIDCHDAPKPMTLLREWVYRRRE